MNAVEFSELLYEVWFRLVCLSGMPLEIVLRDGDGGVISQRTADPDELANWVEERYDDVMNGWEQHRPRLNSLFPDTVQIQFEPNAETYFPSAHAAVVAVLQTWHDNRSEGFDEKPFDADPNELDSFVSAMLDKECSALSMFGGDIAVADDTIREVNPDKTADIDPPKPDTRDELVARIRDRLKGQRLKLFNYLLDKKHKTTFNTIRNDQKLHDAFNVEDPDDSTISKALERLQQELIFRGVDMTVGTDYTRMTFETPPDNLADK